MDHRASSASTGTSVIELAAGGKNKKVTSATSAVNASWHARAVHEGLASPTSLCGLYRWPDGAALSWDDPAVGQRCVSCAEMVAHPSPYGDDDLWDKNGFDRLTLCIVCQVPAASPSTGTHAVLSLRQNHGPAHAVARQTVAVHLGCAAAAETTAHEQGYEWEYPSRPETGRES